MSAFVGTLALAWRNVLRNRRRTLLTLAAIALAAVAIVLLGGYVSATIKALQTGTVREFGHLQIMARGYLEFGRANPARFAIADPDKLIARLRADPVLAPMLAVVTPTLQVQGVAGHFASGSSSNFVGTGWVPKDRLALLAWDGLGLRMPPAGTRLRDDRAEDGVIGVGLAQLLGLCASLQVRNCVQAPRPDLPDDRPEMAGDLAVLAREAHRALPPLKPEGDEVPIELLAAGASGAPNVVRMNVVRAEQQGVRDYDRMYVSMPLTLAQRLVFGPDERSATSIVVQLARTQEMPAARARIEAILAEVAGDTLELRPFQDIAPAYNQIVAMFGTMFGFVAILMAVVTLFSVANTVNMAVSERTGEIGTLRAIGLRRRQLRHMFVIEGGLLGLLGALLGVAIALAGAKFGINPAGLRWTPPGNATPVPIGIDIAGSTLLCVMSVGVLGALACLSSWWPARRASMLEIVEALRHA
jgi:putative ABC transport system permease protein